MSPRTYRTVWAGRFKCGEPVTHQDRLARVISFPADAVPNGCVPIMYSDNLDEVFKIPADDLERVPPNPVRRQMHLVRDLYILIILAVIFTVLAHTR